MTTYAKLDELISNLEESSDKLVNLVEVAEAIRDLKRQQDDLLKKFANAGGQVKFTSDELLLAKKEILGATDRLMASGKKLEATSTDTVQHIRTSLTNLQNKIDDRLKEVQETVVQELSTIQGALVVSGKATDDRLQKIESKIGEQFDRIKQENRQHYNDLEKLVRLKLDESLLQVKQFIEHERGQTKDVIHDRAQKAEEHLDSQLAGVMNSFHQKQQSLQAAIWSFGIIGLAAIGLIIAKLFNII